MHQFIPLNSTLVHLGHQIFIIYTKINYIKLCVVESNGVWWNGTSPIPPYIDYSETYWIGLVDWIGGIVGLMEWLNGFFGIVVLLV
jgi:hypothetical protein